MGINKQTLVNGREDQQDIPIGASDRAKLNTFIVSDYIDRHFSCGKGSPLYALLKKSGEEIETDKILVHANRKAYESSNDADAFDSFGELITRIRQSALSLGLKISELKTLIDFKSFLVKEEGKGKISTTE